MSLSRTKGMCLCILCVHNNYRTDKFPNQNYEKYFRKYLVVRNFYTTFALAIQK